MQKILIVDDEAKIIEVLKAYAEAENYEVDGAENGFEAIEKCKNNKYDLVIMDVMMPKLDGFSAVKEIRAFSSVPVIMLSARGEEDDKIRGFDLGVDDYVVKPFSPKEVMARIGAVLKRGAKRNDGDSLGYRYYGQKRLRRRRACYAYAQRIRVAVLYG